MRKLRPLVRIRKMPLWPVRSRTRIVKDGATSGSSVNSQRHARKVSHFDRVDNAYHQRDTADDFQSAQQPPSNQAELIGAGQSHVDNQMQVSVDAHNLSDMTEIESVLNRVTNMQKKLLYLLNEKKVAEELFDPHCSEIDFADYQKYFADVFR